MRNLVPRRGICLVWAMGMNGRGFLRTRNRVVITGMGVLAPNGTGLKAFWKSLLAGESGIGPITLFDPTGFSSRIAGEVKEFDPADYFEPKMKPKRMARHTQLAYAATMLALKDAGLDPEHLQLPSPTPVVVGVSPRPLAVTELVFEHFSTARPARLRPCA